MIQRSNWRVVAFAVGGCWLIFALMLLLLGEHLTVFHNPFPLFIKAIFGILVYGYVGGTGGWTIETIFVYWTLAGLGLSWLFHKTPRKSAVFVFFVLHVVLSALTLIPMMLLVGR